MTCNPAVSSNIQKLKEVSLLCLEVFIPGCENQLSIFTWSTVGTSLMSQISQDMGTKHSLPSLNVL